MKPKNHSRFVLSQISLLVFGMLGAQAANFTFDANTSTTGAQDGSGTWNTANVNWWNGSADVAWGAANVAVFGAGTDGSYAITLGNATTAQALTFSNSGYTLSAASAQTLTLTNTGNGVIAVASGKTANLGSNATVAFNAASNTGTRIDLTTSGTLNIDSGGTLTRTGQVTAGFSTTGGTLGFMGSGTINVAGTLSFNVGTPVANGGIVVAANAGNSNILNVNGGTVSSNSTINGVALTGSGTSGTINLNSGTISTTGTAGVTSGINLANGTGTTGTFNLNGGTLSTFQINSNYLNGSNVLTTGGTSNFNFAGGTLKAIANNTAFMGGLSAATVKAGGALVDSNGFNVTIAQALLHDSTLGASPDGGLAKSGAGTLNLSGTSTYTGPTNINNGALQLSGTGSINSSSAITVNGSAAKFIQTSSTASTVPVSLISGTVDGTGAAAAVTVTDNATNTITNGNGGTNPLTLATLSFGGDAAVSARYGTSTPIVVTGALSTTPANGQVTLNVPVALSNGIYNLINFGSFSGSLSDFTLSATALGPRQNAAAMMNGNNIAVNVTGENIVWRGANADWDTGAVSDDSGTNNWARKTAKTPTNFWAGDIVEFNDTYDIGAGSVPVTQNTVNIVNAVSPTSTLFNNSSVDYVVSGNAIAAGTLGKSGTGTVTLTNANTYTGTTTINQGTLQLGDGTTADGSLATASAITNNASLVYNTVGNQTVANTISGTGVLVKKGFSTLTLTGANTYSGGTTIDEGALTAGVNGLNGGPITLNANGTLTFTGNGQTSTSTLTGSGSIFNNTANTIVITGDHTGFNGSFTHSAAANNTQFNSPVAASQDASYTLSAGEIIFAASGDYTIKFGSLASTGGNIRGGNTATGITTVEVGNLGADTIINGNFNNGTTKVLALHKVGAGTLTFNGGVNYTGTTTVDGGTLAFGTVAKTLGGSAFTVANSAGLRVKAASPTTTMLPTASLTLGNSTLAFDFTNFNPTVPQITTGDLALNGNLTVNLTNAVALGTGSYKLIDYTNFSGSGTLPTGTYNVGQRSTATIVHNTIDTSIDLNVTTDAPKWTGLDSGEWMVGSTGSNKNWKLAVSNAATDYLDDDQVLFDDSATGTRNVVINSNQVFPASTTFSTAASNYTLSGPFGIASGTLTKSGSGSVTISNTNTYTGATAINGGTLTLGNGTSDGSIASTSGVANNGTLAFNLLADQTAAYPITGTGSLTKTGAGILTLSGTNTYSGGSSVNGGSVSLVGTGTLGTGSIAIASGSSLINNKVLALTNVVTGSGAIINNNTFTNTGDFSGFNGSFTHNSVTSSVAFNTANSTSQNASYDIASAQGSAQGMIAGGNGDYTLKLGSLSGVANSLFRGGITATGTTILEIGNLGTNTEFAGSINNGTNKTIGLTKVGTGTLTLSGASTYTAATLVNAGTLSVTGSLVAASAVTVNTGATLKGTGTVAGAIIGSGTIAPGTSAGTLTTGAVTLTGTLAVEIDGATGDKLLSTGAIDLTGSTLTVTLLSGGFTETSYVIAEGTSITGTFSSIPSGYSVNIISGGTGQQAVLTSSAGGYTSWASSHAGGQTANLDFDFDGVANGVEYFMNSAAGFTANPAIVSGAITWPNGGNIPASAYGTQFVVQTSSNLSIWTDVPAGNLTTNTNSTLTYTLPTGAGKLFVRLVVTPN